MSIGGYGIGREVSIDFDEAERRVRKTLEDEGFGVLTEIDVKATLHKKLEVDMPRYKTLGACNPRFAHQAILAEPDIGLLLPCNVVVREVGPGRTVLEALDPVIQLELTGNAAIKPLAAEVRARLARAVELAAGSD